MGLLNLFLAHLLLCGFQVACIGPGSENQGKTDTIYNTALTLGATEFIKLVDTSPWVKDQLTTSTQFTVFVPDNEAFKTMSKETRKALENPNVVDWVLRYHMAIGIHPARDYKHNLLIPSAFKPSEGGYSLQSLRVNIYEAFSGGHRKVYTVSGAKVFKPDYECTNGLIHIVKKVIYPIPTGINIAEFFSVDPRFSMLNQLLQKVNLTSALATEPTKPLTVFAPSDEAIKKLTPEQQKKLNNATYLNQTLLTHVVGDAYYYGGFYDFKTFKSLNGKQLVMEMGPGGVTIQQKMLVGFDITLTNGVVHILSEVILPKGNEREEMFFYQN
ncbi:transforming growth factor-beta-induced protein ig-h3-like [Ptychodera flava]|uniref:transforming growth factor-beta-induced protein ig-h3-like n=1 Tax=Ptychodera flava TaxID=63121 RepID=UPI003969E2DC